MRTIYWHHITATQHKTAHVARAHYKHGLCIDEHDHDFAEIFFVLNGCGTHRIKGCEHPLQPGLVALIHPETAHSIHSLDNLEYINVAFETSVLEEFTARYDSSMMIDNIHFHCTAESLHHLCGLAIDLGHNPSSILKRDLFLLSYFHEKQTHSSTDQRFEFCPEWLRNACLKMCRQTHFQRGASHLCALTDRTLSHV